MAGGTSESETFTRPSLVGVLDTSTMPNSAKDAEVISQAETMVCYTESRVTEPTLHLLQGGPPPEAWETFS